jgi:hypothetical protein
VNTRNFVFALAATLLLSSASVYAQHHDKNDHDEQPGTVKVDVRDYCDPVSFAQIGCDRTVTPVANGIITLTGFQAELGADKSVGAWRFAPDEASAKEGATLQVKNLGGETHTFTRVKEFGGGFVAGLNAASGNTTPAPECAQVVNGNLVPQPASATNQFLPAGTSATAEVKEGETANFQCCIHPWMRITVNADEHDEHHDHGNK